MTLNDLIHSLRQLDEVTVVEILDLRTDQIVDRCLDLIEAQYDKLKFKVEDPREVFPQERQELTGHLSWKTSNTEALDYDGEE